MRSGPLKVRRTTTQKRCIARSHSDGAKRLNRLTGSGHGLGDQRSKLADQSCRFQRFVYHLSNVKQVGRRFSVRKRLLISIEDFALQDPL